jgi:hypothetical protein
MNIPFIWHPMPKVRGLKNKEPTIKAFSCLVGGYEFCDERTRLMQIYRLRRRDKSFSPLVILSCKSSVNIYFPCGYIIVLSGGVPPSVYKFFESKRSFLLERLLLCFLLNKASWGFT